MNTNISLFFRQPETKYVDMRHAEYVMNSYGDTWFRTSQQGIAGYGILFKDLKLTSSNKFYFDGSVKYGMDGNRTCYKVSAMYVPSQYTSHVDWENYYKKVTFWLVIPENEDIVDVVEMINEIASETYKP